MSINATLIGQMITGVVQRYEGGAATVSLTNVEAILPRGEQIPGETHHANERVRATVYEVRKAGSRVRVIISRTKPHLVQRLFEQEIPEIADGVIEIRAIAREPGYRSKVAVISSDNRVDCVGACVGVLMHFSVSSGAWTDMPLTHGLRFALLLTMMVLAAITLIAGGVEFLGFVE